MKLVSTGMFDELQQAFVGELIRIIKGELERIDAPPELLSSLSGRIAFAVSSLIDDVAGFEYNGNPVSPMLTFLVGKQDLEFAGGNSWMHEYVYRLLPTIFPGTTGAAEPASPKPSDA